MKYLRVVILLSVALLMEFQSTTLAQSGSGSPPAGKTIDAKPKRPETNRNTLVKGITLTVPKGIRRRYGTPSAPDPASVTKIAVKAPSGVTVTLNIIKLIPASAGSAGFNTGGLTTKTVAGTGAPVQIDVFGIAESSQAEDLKIMASATGLITEETKFIVFSKYEATFSSPVTQHKDAAAPCLKCDVQAGVTEIHRHHKPFPTSPIPGTPCDHVSFEDDCVHCLWYCFRCCAKVYTGLGNQDDYKEDLKPTVEDNHGLMLDDQTMMKLVRTPPTGGTGPELDCLVPSTIAYELLYNLLLVQKKFIVKVLDHSGIVYGISKNDEDGTVHDPSMILWNPTSARSEWLGGYPGWIYPRK